MKFLLTLAVVIAIVIKGSFIIIDNVSNTIVDRSNKIESALNVDIE